MKRPAKTRPIKGAAGREARPLIDLLLHQPVGNNRPKSAYAIATSDCAQNRW
jgi:hypothetical protein